MKLAIGIAVALSLAGLPVPATDNDHPTPLRASSFHHDGVLGTSIDLSFVTSSPQSAVRAEGVALAEVERLRRVLSSWDNGSELSQLFIRGSLDHPSAELVAVLGAYTRWRERSAHAYSARTGELTSLWSRAAAAGTPPDARTLASVTAEIARPAWRVDLRSGRIVALTTHRADLNSLGKGFIIDRALQAVRDSVADVRGALVNIGGDIHVWGTPPDGDAWHVAVANPLDHADNARPLTQVALHGGAVSSSGDYERGFTIGVRRYSHIFDPRTGLPVDHIVGATVIAPDNATANALATTLSVLSVDSGMALVRTVNGAEALVVTVAGNAIRTPGFSTYEVDAPAAARPAGAAAFTAKLAVDVNPTIKNRHAPFVAVWITDTTGRHVRTLVFWGDKVKYQHEMTRWWGANHTDAQLVEAVTRATRPAGKYSLEWDGLDQKGGVAAAGPYMFWLEVAFEDGAHSAKSVTLTCGAASAAGTIPTAAAFTGADVSCDPAKH